MVSVLIAQVNFTYSDANKNAKLQYAFDQMLIVTRLEHNQFGRFVGVIIMWFCYICRLVNEIVKVRYSVLSSKVAHQADAFLQFLYHDGD